MLRQLFSIRFQRTPAAGEERSTWLCFRLCALGRPVCIVCSWETCARIHDHECWALAVDLCAAIFRPCRLRKFDWSGRTRPRKDFSGPEAESPRSPLLLKQEERVSCCLTTGKKPTEFLVLKFQREVAEIGLIDYGKGKLDKKYEHGRGSVMTNKQVKWCSVSY